MEETVQIISGQLKRFNEMKKQNLNINNPLDCYLINNDMITEICNKHNSSLNSDNNQINNNKIKNKSINIGLLLTENLKINDIDYPCNFFIIEKENFEKLVHENNLLLEFKLYKVLIGESGIFILNEEMNKDRYIVYYIYDMDLNDCKIDKIFIFKKIAEFQKEIELLNKKGRDYYFNSRNIINDKTGYYNLIDDGKIIGKYINLKRIDKFKIKPNNKKEDNNNKNKDNTEDYEEKIRDNNGNISENKNGNNNVVDDEDNYEYIEEDGVQKKNENYTKNKEIIKLFFPHLLICLTKINLLKSSLVPIIKRSPVLSKYKIIQLFSKLLEKNNINEIFESDNNELIDNFIEEFFMQNLHEKLYLDKDNILSNYENMIKILINKLREDYLGLFVNSNQKVLSVFNILFYGKKSNQSNISEDVYFNTLYIDPEDYCGNETHISLENIINDFKFKEKVKIKVFPKIMIIIALNQYENFLTIPLKLNIKEIKINYNLVCGISSEEQNLVSFIKNDENIFLKINFDFDKKTVKPLENQNELNKCFIYFYEEEKDKNEGIGYYSINYNDYLNKKFAGNISNIESNNNTINNNNLAFMNNNNNYNNNNFNNFNNNNNYNMNNNNLNYMNNNNYDLNNMNNNNNINNNNNLILNNMNSNNNFGFNYMNINNNNLNQASNNFALNNNNQNNINYMNNNIIPYNNYTNNNNLNLYYMNNNYNNLNNNDLSLNPSKINYNSIKCISSSNSNNYNLNNMGGNEGNSKCINNICNSMNNIKSNSNYNINTFNNNNFANINFKTGN